MSDSPNLPPQEATPSDLPPEPTQTPAVPPPQKVAIASVPTAEEEIRRKTRRSLITGAVAGSLGVAGLTWLRYTSREDGLPWPLRRMLEFNQRLAQGLGSPDGLAPLFPADRVQKPARTNGTVGLDGEIDVANWVFRIQHEGRNPELKLPLDALSKVPRHEMIAEFKCVEGWSQVMQFGGMRFRDFMTKFGFGTRSGRPPDPVGRPDDLYRYVSLMTPDEEFFVGLDMASALHPQTLLCDTMNWEPLTTGHGAPLRIYLSVKYGYKSLKRIGMIRFQDERPRDFWADRGYDWYGGL